METKNQQTEKPGWLKRTIARMKVMRSFRRKARILRLEAEVINCETFIEECKFKKMKLKHEADIMKSMDYNPNINDFANKPRKKINKK